MPQPAVFLDRDGTINVEVNYLHQPALVRLEQTVGTAIARLNAAGWPVVVITNQSGIARSYYTEADMHAVHQRIAELLEPFGAHIDAWYWCAHHPEVTGACACRKPGTALFEQAAHEHNLTLRGSWMVGDKLLDVEAGINVGARSIMVASGYGSSDQARLPAQVQFAPTLIDAVELILAARTVSV